PRPLLGLPARRRSLPHGSRDDEIVVVVGCKGFAQGCHSVFVQTMCRARTCFARGRGQALGTAFHCRSSPAGTVADMAKRTLKAVAPKPPRTCETRIQLPMDRIRRAVTARVSPMFSMVLTKG